MGGSHRLFLSRWLRDPLAVGSVVPSGRALANALAAAAAGTNGWVVELGGGTGTVTRALLEAGIAPGRIAVVERDPDLHRYLAARLPEVRVLLGDARDIESLLAAAGIGTAAAIVSCLPLLSRSAATREAILAAAFRTLEPDGFFLQFTFGPLSPVSAHLRRALGIEGSPTAQVWRNLPPATVWRYARERAAAAEHYAKGP